MALVFGMTVVWVGCSTSSDDVATLKIVNEYSSPITRVEVTGYFSQNVNIKPSSSQTISMDFRGLSSVTTEIYLYYGGGHAKGGIIDLRGGATCTVTLRSDGTVLVQVK
jgi:hypothetical protein